MTIKQSSWFFICWILLSALIVALLTLTEFSKQKAELIGKATSLHRLVSQRADQHDAHLTGLSALASANEKPLTGMMLNLSEMIRKYYSRISHIDLIKLDKTKPISIFSTRATRQDKKQINLIRDAAYASTGRLQIIPLLDGYSLVKRSPNSNKVRYGLALFIDGQKLLENDLGFGSQTQLILKTQLGGLIYETQALDKQGLLSQTVRYKSTLGSRSQPLSLEIIQTISATDYIRWQFILPFIILSAVGMVLTRSYFDQKQKIRLAEHRALLGEHEARIAQASRINGLGEMASGLAHEITQPLTAILSQSQAGAHLVGGNAEETEALKQVLKSISKQAKRGGDIIQRLRSWTTHSQETIEIFDLNSVAKGIRDLMKADLMDREIVIETALYSGNLKIEADHVAIEQVVFNLARNGVDAMEGKPSGHLVLSTDKTDTHAIISVCDNGSGISEKDFTQLYDPFFTTKENGMGLGLSLCENIVNRYNGHIEIKNNPSGGVTSVVSLPLLENEQGL